MYPKDGGSGILISGITILGAGIVGTAPGPGPQGRLSVILLASSVDSWSRCIPMALVNSFVPRPIGKGLPELIASRCHALDGHPGNILVPGIRGP